MFQACEVKIAKIAAHSAPRIEPGKSPRKKVTVKDRKPEDRYRLQDVEQWNEDELGAPALGGKRRVDESEDQRGGDGGEHAQRRAQGIIGQEHIVERNQASAQAWAGAPTPCQLL